MYSLKTSSTRCSRRGSTICNVSPSKYIFHNCEILAITYSIFDHNSFDEDLDKLASIPILTALTQNAAKPFHAFDDAFGDNNSSFSRQAKQQSNEAAVVLSVKKAVRIFDVKIILG